MARTPERNDRSRGPGSGRAPERAREGATEGGAERSAGRDWTPTTDKAARGRPHGRPRRNAAADVGWLWGWHPVEAALANPARVELQRLVAVQERAAELGRKFGRERLEGLSVLDHSAIGQLLPSGAVHQGVALLAPPLEPLSIEELAEPAQGVIVLLDGITDPQNVGAIFRSAAAFGARGVVLQDRHAPPLTGALAKAAAGAVEKVSHARVVNLSRALERLSDLGWRAVGLAGEAPDSLEAVLDARPTVLVLGSEGEGIRRLVAEHCDALGRIAMPGGFESLNVSAAAAVALYEAVRPR
jgi:23S rRNA (guanosine2251-2'-O)-methyltransferase